MILIAPLGHSSDVDPCKNTSGNASGLIWIDSAVTNVHVCEKRVVSSFYRANCGPFSELYLGALVDTPLLGPQIVL